MVVRGLAAVIVQRIVRVDVDNCVHLVARPVAKSLVLIFVLLDVDIHVRAIVISHVGLFVLIHVAPVA